MNLKKFLFLFIFILLFSFSKATTWNTVSSGFWNNNSIWEGGAVPPYSSSDTFLIHHPVAFENNLFFNSGCYVKIDTAGGLCGHHNISVFTNAKILKHGILELDTLFIPGGQVICNATGDVVLTLSGIISNGGSMSVNGCNFSVGPWFDCIQPAYGFTIGISEASLNNRIAIFPNPGNGKFEISAEHFAEKSQLIITDLLGKTMHTQLLNLSEENCSIDLSFLENGIYSWLLISNDNQIVRGKIEIIK